MAMLRDKNTGRLGLAYQKLDEPARRKFLVEKLSGTPHYEKLDFDAAAYDLAEWYATPMDMARALAWLKQNTRRDQAAHPLRAILAVEPKLPHDAKIWPYVGFKGGSEDQLLCGNWLLQHRQWPLVHVPRVSEQPPGTPGPRQDAQGDRAGVRGYSTDGGIAFWKS